jgi:hypothetical protein
MPSGEDEVADFPVDDETRDFPHPSEVGMDADRLGRVADSRQERYRQAGILSGQQILRGGVYSLIEQHDRWLKDVQGWSDEERERLG